MQLRALWVAAAIVAHIALGAAAAAGAASPTLKILMYQIAFSPSHMPFSGAIADALIDRGHIVDKIIIVLNPAVHSNGSTRLRHVYRIERPKEENPFVRLSHLVDPFKPAADPRHNADYREARYLFCRDLLDNNKLITQLRAEKYDVYLTTPFDYCGLGLNHALQIPSCSAYSSIAYEEYAPKYLGIPQPSSYVQYGLDPHVAVPPFTFWQRVRALLVALDHHVFTHGIGDREYAYLSAKFSAFPAPVELFARLTYIFRNTNELIAAPRPDGPKTRFIGGLVANKQRQDLPAELESILSQPSNGTIVFSLGSLLQSTAMSRTTKESVLRAFATFSAYTFIFKMAAADPDRDLLAAYANVHALAWLPQVALLSANSYYELSCAGKPFISIPIFADQYCNTGAALRNGVALYVDKTELTTPTLVAAIGELLGNPSYARCAAEIAAMLADRPHAPRDALVRAVEYAARHPRLASLLQLDGARLSFVTYYSLDIIAASVLVVLTALILAFCALRRLASRLRQQSSQGRKAKRT